MVIGFTQRRQTVAESDVLEGEDFIDFEIPVATLITAEREHPMDFRLQSGGTAIVEPRDDRTNLLLDAVFGSRAKVPTDPIEDFFILLPPPNDMLPPLIAEVRNDLRPEDEECFTIRIFPVDVPGRRELFVCYEDDDEQDNFFCETTICIEDDDGRI